MNGRDGLGLVSKEAVLLTKLISVSNPKLVVLARQTILSMCGILPHMDRMEFDI
jgi:hypothetical protein